MVDSKVKEIRLDLLCKIHNLPDGDINEFNRAYRIDFSALTSAEFAASVAWVIMNPIDIRKVS